MTEHEDYLWDRSGEQDSTVQKLEELLSPLAHDGRELPLTAADDVRARRVWPWLVAVATAASIAIGFALLWGPANEGKAELQPGAPTRTFVAAKDRLVVKLGPLASITLEPGSKLHFEHWRPEEALFRLERGTLTARVAPPPAVAPDFFLIDTPLGRVTDKGCRYELRIESDGTNVVDVTEGAVTFAFTKRTVYVPAGAATRVTSAGPSTPMFVDSSNELRQAVKLFDNMTGLVREKGMYAITQACREPRDSLVLWHLLREDDDLLREQAEAALYDLVGPPEPETGKGPQRWDPEVWLAYLRIGPWMQAK